MEDEQDSGKTVEELAREAMQAIKESERREKQKIEDEIKAREAAMKQEIEDKIKKKMRKLQREQEEAEKNKAPEVDTRFMVTWTNPDGNGIIHIGKHKDKNLFRINRGITLFHLYVTSDKVICEDWRRNGHTSMYIDSLKSKADSILSKSNEKSNKKSDENSKNL